MIGISEAFDRLSNPIRYDFGFVGNRLLALICLPIVMVIYRRE